MQLNTPEELIEDLRRGKMVILMDDEDRENEGDLVMVSELVRAEDINFMATHARGLICLTITQERAKRLNLAPMAAHNKSQFSTNFTASIEAAVEEGRTVYPNLRKAIAFILPVNGGESMTILISALTSDSDSDSDDALHTLQSISTLAG